MSIPATNSKTGHLSRRQLLVMSASGAALSALPFRAHAQEENDLKTLKKELFGDREIKKGKVSVTMPPISENGNSVPFEFEVESPMIDDDHVTRAVILSPINPEPLIADYGFTPASGKAAVATRIRLAGSQNVEVIAEMSDGTLWMGSEQTLVTLAACVIG
ncbi:MAG: sulfur oxidation protein SoxY [Ponticaulis sp.]|nr:sulfur oxidation protein SoxY [Ponticaulis sp.]|tara:strand:+ start:21430 stop:21912 length:483 start_codon:yes stop_codon:yes gene_type:complete